MNLNNKHRAIIGTYVLIGIFLLIAIWYMAVHPAPATVLPVPPSTSIQPTSPMLHLTEHGQYDEVDLSYPASTPLAQLVSTQADTAAVAFMKGALENEIVTFKKNIGDLTPEDIQAQRLGDGRVYSMQGGYQTYSSPHTVSYIFIVSIDYLGAHPGSKYLSFTFDTRTGTQVTLADLFTSKDYLTFLSDIARSDLSDQIKPGDSFQEDWINTGTEPKEESFQNWYLDRNNLVLLFPEYQVAAYAYGPLKVSIPRFNLTKILKPEFIVKP